MTNKELMKEAIIEAKIAYSENEVPVGAIIAKDGKIIARAHNRRHNDKCSIYHAEMLAIEQASQKLDRWILSDCEMYVTLEPCIMCTGAIIAARLKKIYVGAESERFGSCFDIIKDYEHRINHSIEIEKGLYKKEIEEMMKSFFINVRKGKEERNVF